MMESQETRVRKLGKPNGEKLAPLNSRFRVTTLARINACRSLYTRIPTSECEFLVREPFNSPVAVSVCESPRMCEEVFPVRHVLNVLRGLNLNDARENSRHTGISKTTPCFPSARREGKDDRHRHP